MQPTMEVRRISSAPAPAAKRLDIVIPYTTRVFTERALAEADRLSGSGRNRIRVVRIYEIPVHLSIDSAAIPIEHLRGELVTLKAEHEFYGELVLTRDTAKSWMDLIDKDRVIVIASPRRIWRTPQERFARRLARMGHKVIVVYGGNS